MLKFFATDVSVSKGYDGSPALRFSESDGVSRVRFRVGKRVYDSRCENNHRYINLRVKASGDLCERIRKMKLKEGSFINISGRYDEETIKDDETGKEKTYPIIILDDIKFCFTGSKKNGQSENEAPGDGYGAPPRSPVWRSVRHTSCSSAGWLRCASHGCSVWWRYAPEQYAACRSSHAGTASGRDASELHRVREFRWDE